MIAIPRLRRTAHGWTVTCREPFPLWVYRFVFPLLERLARSLQRRRQP